MQSWLIAYETKLICSWSHVHCLPIFKPYWSYYTSEILFNVLKSRNMLQNEALQDLSNY